jgi:hypothetical protein
MKTLFQIIILQIVQSFNSNFSTFHKKDSIKRNPLLVVNNLGDWKGQGRRSIRKSIRSIQRNQREVLANH